MKSKLMTLTMGPLLLAMGCAESDEAERRGSSVAAASNDLAKEASADVQAATLAVAADRSWLTLRGRVVSTTPSAFVLGFGDETVTVEMDDWDWYQEGRSLKAGDEVVVSGRVDQDLWERKKIEASSVFVRNLSVHFFANGADEELATSIVAVPSPTAFSDASGLVSNVEGREFTVGGNSGPVRVDTSQVAAPVKVKVGDRIYAWGELDIDPQEKLELMAEGVVIVSPDKTKTAEPPSAARKESP